MVTTVGTSNDPKTMIENFIYLERDAISAYEATIERLENPAHKAKIDEFRGDHLRHLEELTRAAENYGVVPPSSGDAKEMLTTGKIKLANLMGGDGALLKAMSTNEDDTISAYRHGTENPSTPGDLQPLFASALADEERHKAWMDQAARAA